MPNLIKLPHLWIWRWRRHWICQWGCLWIYRHWGRGLLSFTYQWTASVNLVKTDMVTSFFLNSFKILHVYIYIQNIYIWITIPYSSNYLVSESTAGGGDISKSAAGDGDGNVPESIAGDVSESATVGYRDFSGLLFNGLL